jgi:hypothetical protein
VFVRTIGSSSARIITDKRPGMGATGKKSSNGSSNGSSTAGGSVPLVDIDFSLKKVSVSFSVGNWQLAACVRTSIDRHVCAVALCCQQS